MEEDLDKESCKVFVSKETNHADINDRCPSKDDNIFDTCDNDELHSIVDGINDLRDHNKNVSVLRPSNIFQKYLRKAA